MINDLKMAHFMHLKFMENDKNRTNKVTGDQAVMNHDIKGKPKNDRVHV